MPGTRSKHDPAAIFLIGDQYRNASDILAAAIRGSTGHDVRMPAIVCSAFALELYFKCLITAETGKTPGIHDLRKLFNALGKNTQHRIRDRFAPYLASAQLYIAESLAQSKEPVPIVDFDYVLEMSRSAFSITRYIYEGLPSMAGWIAGGILEATREIILEDHPTWEKLIMDLHVAVMV